MTALVGEFLGLEVVVAGAGIMLAQSADSIATVTRLGRLLVGSLRAAPQQRWRRMPWTSPRQVRRNWSA